ncbi:MAG: tetratricopeptide (TPR) repeat protein [Sphingobacteriales bacterium]
MENFGFILEMNPEDTVALYNSALAAERSGNSDLTREFYGKLIGMDYDQPEMYRSLANNYLTSSDTASGLTIIEKGRTRYPEYNGLVIDELNIYIAQGKLKEAIGKLEAATTADPENQTLFFALGAAADNIQNFQKAIEAYKKAIELDGNYFAANYNLGALFYNKGVNLVQAANKISFNDTKAYEKAKASFIAEFNSALPYLEKSLELDSEDKNTLISLKEIYVRLGDLEKSKEMKQRLDAIGG